MVAAVQWCLSRRRSLLLVFWFIGCAVETVTAQTLEPTTDPDEARILNAIFERWGISVSAQWNISGELCSGDAIDPSVSIGDINPGIKCGCDYNNDTTCHITALRIFRQDVVGTIPDELWNLTYLDDLNLGRNYLTGPLSPSIGRLTRMQYFTVGVNALSGKLPKEIGLLTDLRSLGFGTNNFSGPLPSELGDLKRLTQIYFDSSGVSGPIPETFADLQSLETVWASDNELTGRIPDFIGNWTSLRQLRLQGNSFQGSIPQSFSRLSSLTDLRISDLSNGSFSLELLRNMNSLATLVLRNNKISSTIPSLLGEFQNLTLLDLSFNNLSGGIPVSLFSHSSLTHLFLGNNKLFGEMPSQKSSSLQYIDLSYNDLSGSFPSWVNGQNLQLNLVANNFTFGKSDESAFPSGLDCLQRDFPCNRESPRYSEFAIKCGGPQITSSDNVVYEADDESLGPATYYMINSKRWAVSNTGLPSDSNPKYNVSTSSQITNTLNVEMFRTARTSAGSLRYYGLGLDNGNYTVTLEFAEVQSENSKSWRSLGRRVFDIYVQGNLELKDFDIKREAGGALRAVSRQFTVKVSENYIEIHLFWAGKGTCCVPAQGSYGPLISTIKAKSDFRSTVSNKPPSTEKNRTGMTVGIVVGVVAASLLSLIAVFYMLRKQKKERDFEDDELMGIDTRPYTFSYAELGAATGDFDLSNKLGEGGFGPVYKGTLEDGRAVAVKLLSVASQQGKSQFIAEIAIISAVQHRNLVKLHGCCIEGDKRLLVYEYLENKSLDKLLFGPGSKTLFLNWAMRFDICMGVARGLAYLHEESRLRIVHRDVKASNILLDSNLTPKISDFGLAKLYDDNKSHMSTRVAGTIGYLAPEYALRGHLSEKADVFSFGVVALEIISGRPNSDSSLQGDMIYLLEWAWNLHENNNDLYLVDTTLNEYDEAEVRRIIGVALLCTQASPALRPVMSRVVAMLSGDIEVASVTTRPGYLTDWRFNDTTTFISNTDSSTSGADVSNIQSTTSTSTSTRTSTKVTNINSPGNPSQPILGEGR